MRKKESIDEIALQVKEETNNKIKIRFSEYAIKKYGCDELELKKFYRKYDRAVEFYKKRNENIKLAGFIIGGLSAVAGAATAGMLYCSIMIANFAGLAGTFIGAVLTTTLLVNGTALKAYGKIGLDEEYELKTNNPYIGKNTKFHHMAEDYCKMKKLAFEKAKK